MFQIGMYRFPWDGKYPGHDTKLSNEKEGKMISNKFSAVSTCNLCLDLINKFIGKKEPKTKNNPSCKCKECKCSK